MFHKEDFGWLFTFMGRISDKLVILFHFVTCNWAQEDNSFFNHVDIIQSFLLNSQDRCEILHQCIYFQSSKDSCEYIFCNISDYFVFSNHLWNSSHHISNRYNVRTNIITCNPKIFLFILKCSLACFSKCFIIQSNQMDLIQTLSSFISKYLLLSSKTHFSK